VAAADFAGLTGRVRFDRVGDRRVGVAVAEWTREAPATLPGWESTAGFSLVFVAVHPLVG